MKRFAKTLAGAALGGLLWLTPLSSEEANGFITVSYPASNTLLIVDTNSRKILMYSVSESKGISLREVRSFAKALEAPQFFTPKGLLGVEEVKTLESIIQTTK